MISYILEQLEDRIQEMNKGGLILSVQFGMVMILNRDNEVLLRLDSLVDKDEMQKAWPQSRGGRRDD